VPPRTSSQCPSEEDKDQNANSALALGKIPWDLETTLVFAMFGDLSLFKQF
jgi:hypothetical protein